VRAYRNLVGETLLLHLSTANCIIQHKKDLTPTQNGKPFNCPFLPLLVVARSSTLRY
jgi:hypothetical protein